LAILVDRGFLFVATDGEKRHEGDDDAWDGFHNMFFISVETVKRRLARK